MCNKGHIRDRTLEKIRVSSCLIFRESLIKDQVYYMQGNLILFLSCSRISEEVPGHGVGGGRRGGVLRGEQHCQRRFEREAASDLLGDAEDARRRHRR